MAVVSCSPCEHGKDLVVLEAPEGSVVWSPTCLDTKGAMRPHVVGEKPKPKTSK